MSAARVSMLVTLLVVTACGGSGGRAPQTQPVRPAAAPSPVSLESLYEAGRYQDVVTATGTTTPNQGSPEQLWLAAHSYQRMKRDDQARGQFGRLVSNKDKAWHLVGQLGTALLEGNAEAIDRGIAAADAYPNHPYVQFELGMALAGKNNYAGAARAMDRSAGVAPDNAYARYYAGLAYERAKRVDLAAERLEAFVRLAPQAPERAQVESILETLRGR